MGQERGTDSDVLVWRSIALLLAGAIITMLGVWLADIRNHVSRDEAEKIVDDADYPFTPYIQTFERMRRQVDTHDVRLNTLDAEVRILEREYERHQKSHR